MTKFQAEFLKQNKNLIFDRFKYKYPDCSEEQFEDYLLKKMKKTFIQDYEEAIKIKDNE